MASVCPYQLPDQKSFTQYLNKLYDIMVKKVKELLETADGVSTTADVWTAHHHSYLGMTVHWIDRDTLKRCKAAIACARITGCHTYDVIASKIEHIHASYGFSGKVVGIITDNGSNFVKAFCLITVKVCWSHCARRFLCWRWWLCVGRSTLLKMGILCVTCRYQKWL